MNNKYETRSILEAALMSVIVFLLMMLSNYIPLINVLIVPIPITILYLRHNKSTAILSVIVSGILLAMFNNILLTVIPAIFCGLTGIILGFCIDKKFKPIVAIAIITLGNLIGLVFNIWIDVYILMGKNLYGFAEEIINVFKESLQIYTNIGIDISSNPLTQIIDQLTPNSILIMLPSIFIIAAIISSILNYVICRSILKRFKYELQPLPPFSNWYLDTRIGAILILIICLTSIASSKGVPYVQYFISTAFSLLQFSMLIIGLSVGVYFLKNKLKMSNGPLIAIVIIVVMSPLAQFIAILGFVDLLIDIRGVDPESLGNVIRKKISTKK